MSDFGFARGFGANAVDFVIVDLDADGDLDVVATRSGLACQALYNQNAAASFVVVDLPLTSSNSPIVSASDVQYGGYPSLWFDHAAAAGVVSMLTSESGTVFTAGSETDAGLGFLGAVGFDTCVWLSFGSPRSLSIASHTRDPCVFADVVLFRQRPV